MSAGTPLPWCPGKSARTGHLGRGVSTFLITCEIIVKKHIPDRKKIRFSRKSVGIFFSVLIILLGTILVGREEVQDFLIPGNGQVTRTAVTKMIADIKEGDSLSDSFEAFCREIVDGANIQES